MKSNRRRFLQLAAAATAISVPSFAAAASVETKPFRYALNFGTLRGFKMPLEKEIDLAAETGYDAVEPWIWELDQYRKDGGKLSELKKRLDGHGLAVAGACSFVSWIVDDEAARDRGIEQLKREMDALREIGGDRIAATAAGATKSRLDDFTELGRRYRRILELGLERGVVPQLEIWGASQTIGNLTDVVALAVASGHARAELLLDVYHLYRGGSSFDALALLNGRCMTNFHVNDYPADPPREQTQDKDRVYPGDGIAPLPQILQTLRQIGFSGFLSFEVFNPAYWATGDPAVVARTGLEKMKALSSGASA